MSLLYSWSPIIDFVESKYEEYLTAESRVHRKAISDSRVHSCLYFIAPSGHGLKMLDIEFSKTINKSICVNKIHLQFLLPFHSIPQCNDYMTK